MVDVEAFCASRSSHGLPDQSCTLNRLAPALPLHPRSTPHGFKNHIENEHNTEHYLFFFMHLLHKPVTEHTGQESHVYALYRRREFSFFPVGERFASERDRDRERDRERERDRGDA